MDAKVEELPLSDKLWAWFEENKKPALIGLVAVVVVGTILGLTAWNRTEKVSASGEALSNLLATRAMMGPRAGQDTEELLRIAEQYPRTPAGARALLIAAASSFEEGKFDVAKSQFERFAREHPESMLMGQAMLGIAASLEAQGKTNDAIAAYKSLVERHPTDIVVPQAKFALGRLYEAQGKPELARSMYEEVLRAEQTLGGSTLANEAGIRLEEFKWRYPNLTPPPPPPSAASPIFTGTNGQQFRIQPGPNSSQPKQGATNPQKSTLSTNKPPTIKK